MNRIFENWAGALHSALRSLVNATRAISRAPAPRPSAQPPRQRQNARSTPEMRRRWQKSDKPSAVLAREDGFNVKTVTEHRRRLTVEDLPLGPSPQGPLCLTFAERAFVLYYRSQTGLSITLCHKNLREAFPRLSRAALARFYKRNGLGALPWDRANRARREVEIA